MTEGQKDLDQLDDIDSGGGDARAQWMETGRLAELGLLSAEMVHELRQPVFAARALVTIMQKQSPDRSELRTLEEQLRHMQALLDRYAASGRRSRGEPEPIDLQATIRSIVEALQARARARHVTLEFIDTSPARAILADPTAVRQIVINLIGNALDAARSTVTVSTVETTVVVKDDGRGVPPEVATRIFDPFFSTKPPDQGTGLGLAIAQQLTDESGSVLEWDTSASGTEFRVRFPQL
jgi:two-component system C4-dicarboxylate transport sensor histidine kinase DctB